MSGKTTVIDHVEWEYHIEPDGYMYALPNTCMASLIIRTVHLSRTWKHRVIYWTQCLMRGHVNDKVMSIVRGFSNDCGMYRVQLCPRCREFILVMIKERKQVE